MKILIAGSRHLYVDPETIRGAIYTILKDFGKTLSEPIEIVHGAAHGIDTCAGNAAHRLGWVVTTFPADWAKYGSSAGVRRNSDMADYADVGMVFWDGFSPGTKNTVNEMRLRDKYMLIFYWRGHGYEMVKVGEPVEPIKPEPVNTKELVAG